MNTSAPVSNRLLYDGSLYEAPELLIWTALVVIMTGAASAGFLIGRRQHDVLDEQAKGYISTTQAIVFSMLTLFLSFTLSAALSRYETRRNVLVQEANAIGTTFLRSLTLPEPYRGEVKQTLREYLEIRDDFYNAGENDVAYKAALKATDEKQVELWRQMERLAASYPDSRLMEQYMVTLNETIDAHGSRVAALASQIPESVIWLLMLLAVVANFFMGYGRGLSDNRQLSVQVGVTLLVALVILIILDIDRPRRGFIQVPNTAIESLQGLVDTFYLKPPPQTRSLPAP